MFAYLIHKLGEWFERAEQHRRDKYLATSSSLADLERRMRYVERNDLPH